MGLVGCGYWGKNYLKTLPEVNGVKLNWVVTKTRSVEPSLLGQTRLTRNLDDLLNDSDTTAVVIATPLNTHYEIARRALVSGKDVLIEKPFTQRSSEAIDLMKIANEKKAILMAGHLFEYHPAVAEMKDIVSKGIIGRPEYISAERSGSNNSKQDSNVMWSFGSHDIYIANAILGRSPGMVNASGLSNDANSDDVAKVRLDYGFGVVADIYLDRTKPKKIRNFVFFGQEGSLTFDDTLEGDKLVAFDKHKREIYHGGNFNGLNTLKRECIHFVECVGNRTRPLTDAQKGYENVRILECAQHSLESKEMVRINP